MKRLTVFLAIVALLTSGVVASVVTAQSESTDDPVIDIPDENLRAVLNTQLGQDDDAAITESQAAAFTGLLFVNTTFEITDFTGLEFFTGAVGLAIRMDEYPSETLDLSAMTGLTTLTLRGGGITSLDISGLDKLAMIDALGMGISEIAWPEDSTALRWIKMNGNDLPNIPVHSNLHVLRIAESSRITSLDMSDIPDLGDLDISDTGITSIDLSPATGLLSANIKNLSLSSHGLSEDHADKLRELHVSDNSFAITTIPSSVLSELFRLSAENMSVESFDVADTPLLNYLWLADNDLSGEFSVCGGWLSTLDISDNELTSFVSTYDIPEGEPGRRRCGNLEWLDISGNQMTDADISWQADIDKFYATGNCFADGGGIKFPPERHQWEPTVNEHEVLSCVDAP